MVVEIVVVVVVIVDFVTVLEAQIVAVVLELQIAIHALPVQAFFRAATKFSQAALVHALVVRFVYLSFRNEGSGIKKVLGGISDIIPLMTFHVINLSLNQCVSIELPVKDVRLAKHFCGVVKIFRPARHVANYGVKIR